MEGDAKRGCSRSIPVHPLSTSGLTVKTEASAIAGGQKVQSCQTGSTAKRHWYAFWDLQGPVAL